MKQQGGKENIAEANAQGATVLMSPRLYLPYYTETEFNKLVVQIVQEFKTR